MSGCGFGLVGTYLRIFLKLQQTGVVIHIPTLIVSVNVEITELISLFTGMIRARVKRTRGGMIRSG